MATTNVSINDLKWILPNLNYSSHKGDLGRIGVIGGCKEYTGGPYYAAMSALKVGCDLIHLFCTAEAAPVIKSYSPELIVHPLLGDLSSTAEICDWLQRMHAIVIGPGLGRDKTVFESVRAIIDTAKQLQLPIVIDADGLFYVNSNWEQIKGYKKLILTPNVMEFSRLFKAVEGTDINVKAITANDVQKLSDLLGNITITCKGSLDIITNGNNVWTCCEQGSPRRCGGQGDILSGSLATFAYWSQLASNSKFDSSQSLMCASYIACWLTRKCNNASFSKHGRSTTTTDMLQEIENAVKDMENITNTH